MSVRALRSASNAGTFLSRLTDAAQVWLAMNILFSFASYGLSSYEWYFAAGLSEVARRFASRLDASVKAPVSPVPVISVHKALAALSPVGQRLHSPMLPDEFAIRTGPTRVSPGVRGRLD